VIFFCLVMKQSKSVDDKDKSQQGEQERQSGAEKDL
jgi:hypothetical protein